MFKWLGGLVDSNDKALKRLQPLVDKINELEGDFHDLSDAALRTKTDELKERLAGGASLDDLLPEAFAAVREAARRTIGQRHFDVQLIGGIVLHQGKIAEMKTGEGKTLVATLPLYLNALTGKGCHLATVNDYLARRDPYWMGPIYHALGLTVASIYPQQTPDDHTPARLYDPTYDSGQERWRHFRPIARGDAYKADIVYGTSAEFGFDYLRDNMVLELSQYVQRPLNYAIVDEVDNLLIDEARTPLIISAPDTEAGKLYVEVNNVVARMKSKTFPHEPIRQEGKDELAALEEQYDYIAFQKEHSVRETARGQEKLARAFNIKLEHLFGGKEEEYQPLPLEDARRRNDILSVFRNSMSAHALYQRDRDYVIGTDQDGKPGIIIVDEFTGRLMHGRRYSEGLHQALEAKERLGVRRESRTYATVTIQNYFRMYRKLAGMTGTAATEAEEFHKIYKLEVLIIPTNKPMIREDFPDRIYKSEQGKFRAVVREIEELNKQGRPVLVGTVSIEKSELLGDMLMKKGIPHQILNAKNHEGEATIIAQAGRPGMVTVATNMAGRGVDIILGGSPPDYNPDEDLQGYIHQKQAAFMDGAVSLLKNEPGFSDWLEKRQLLLKEKFDSEEIKSAADKIRKIYRNFSGEEYTLEAAKEIQHLEEIIRTKIREYLYDYSSFENELEQRLVQKTEELQKLGRHDLLSKLKTILKLKSENITLKDDIGKIITSHHNLLDWHKENKKVVAAGGLHVVGTERHEARRIDNQLRGRAGRQGDPGSSRFYVSLEDDIMRRFGGDRLKTVMGWVGMDEDTPIENSLVSKAIENTQVRVEGYHFDMRKHLVEYDDVVNKHREVIYQERRKVLSGASLKDNILDMVADELRGIAAAHAGSEYSENWDLDTLIREVTAIMPPPADMTRETLSKMSAAEVSDRLVEVARELYEQREREFGSENTRLIERLVMLRVIDSLWVDHLTEMEHMRNAIGLQAVAQRDPLVAYKRQGHEQFQTLLGSIQRDIARTIFHVSIVKQEDKKEAPKPEPSVMAKVARGKANVSRQPAKVGGEKVGRNDPCPCGSGRKYKKCCGK